MALNNKQSQFVIEYLTDFNGHAAAIRAGYSPKTGYSIAWELLRKPEIATALQKAITIRSEKTGITAEYVLGSLKKIADRCQDEKIDAASLKALELLGKNLKLFTDKIEVRTIKSVDDLTDGERAALLADLESRLGE